jgi:O-acetyl-ADP-ribose deacetylase
VNKTGVILGKEGTKWLFKCGNILDEPADVLICSANVSLNLSGGVGAELLGRYGPAMQRALHDAIRSRSPRAAQRGEVVEYRSNEIPYKAVLHAVAINGWYETTAPIVRDVASVALRKCCALGVKRVALTALGTGFGNLSLPEFADAISPLILVDWFPIEQVRLCLLEDYRLRELLGCLEAHRVD